jgi:hypothetical protein
MGASKLVFGPPIGGFTDRKKNAMTATLVNGPPGVTAFIYQCPLNVDRDGAPRAYGLDNDGSTLQVGLRPLESNGPRVMGLSNARQALNWSLKWVGIHSVTEDEAKDILRSKHLITPKPKKGEDVLNAKDQALLDKFWDNRTTTPIYGSSLEDVAGNGKFPIVQLRELHQPAPGYYVSTTSKLKNGGLPLWNQYRYLDASIELYSVVPALPGVGSGDYGLVIRNKTGASTPFYFGDSSGSTSGSTHLGECSEAVYQVMGDNEGVFSFIVFPGSGGTGGGAGMVSGVRSQLGMYSTDDADALAKRLAPDMPELNRVRFALTRAGAPMEVVAVDAISGA